ncbi:MAG TPA: T9SS type A sorting domain-containing protein, partial [Bacteroidales bacterium]|nr:T9SS type A sorting domain-containing protein [Bacteroidales bacterium]
VLTIKYKAALEDEWTTLETFSTDVTEWTEVSIVLPNLSDSYYVAFEGECNSGMGITIDEVSINEPQTQSFVITAGAEGNGTITPSGQVFVPAGETQQFDVKAYHGHQIASLLVDDAAIVAAQGESQFTFTFQSVNAAHTIMAYFTANAQSVTVEVVPHGAGSVSIQGERYYGNTIKLYARSSGSNYVFSHWEADGKTIATENPFKFELLSDTLFEAHFRLVTGIGSRRDLSDHVRVYPNPMKDDLHIDLPIDALVRVFDMQGRLQYEAKLSSGTNTINLSGLNQGTYILKLQFEDQVITKRILHY